LHKGIKELQHKKELKSSISIEENSRSRGEPLVIFESMNTDDLLHMLKETKSLHVEADIIHYLYETK